MGLKSGKEIADTLDKFPSTGKAKMSAGFTAPKATMPDQTSSNTTQDKMDAPWGGRKYSGPSFGDVKDAAVNTGKAMGEMGRTAKHVIGDLMSESADAQPSVKMTKGDREHFQGRQTTVERTNTKPKEGGNRGKMKKSSAPATPKAKKLGLPTDIRPKGYTAAKPKQNFTGASGSYQGDKSHR